MTYKHYCKRCKGHWETVLEDPACCGVCGSQLWRTEKTRNGRGGRPTGSMNLNSKFMHREAISEGSERPKNTTATVRSAKISGERGDVDQGYDFNT